MEVYKGKGLKIPSRDVTISFNDSCQDVLSVLGAPEDVFTKGMDQLNIHQKQKEEHGYFWNYYRLGLDILFHSTTHRVQKIVMYNNIIEHYQVMRYSKCNFHFGDGVGHICHSSDWKNVQRVMGDPLGPPVIFDREDNPFGATSFQGYEGVLFEITKNGSIASVILFAD